MRSSCVRSHQATIEKARGAGGERTIIAWKGVLHLHLRHARLLLSTGRTAHNVNADAAPFSCDCRAFALQATIEKAGGEHAMMKKMLYLHLRNVKFLLHGVRIGVNSHIDLYGDPFCMTTMQTPCGKNRTIERPDVHWVL